MLLIRNTLKRNFKMHGTLPRLNYLIFIFLGLLTLYSTTSNAAVEQGAMKALAAFRCGTYLEHMEKGKNDSVETKRKISSERDRLFKLGYAASIEFLVAAQKNSEFFNDAPFVYRLLLGPNQDFIVGRWFEYTATDTFEKITKAVDDPKYGANDEFRAIAAKKLYLESNCAILGH